MTLDNLEQKVQKQVEYVLTQAVKLQAIAYEVKQQKSALALKAQVKARTSLHRVLDEGLNLIGKALAIARKREAAFVAETQRKEEKLNQRGNFNKFSK